MRRYLLCILALATAMACSAPAAAAQTAVTAKVKGHTTSSVSCDGANLCANAVITGFGSAEYSFTTTGFAFISAACGSYAATTTFKLQDGSTLTLNEAGTICGRGLSFVKGSLTSFGNPRVISGDWVVQAATGQFAGMTGSGTNTLHFEGANRNGTYSGTLTG
jgi:hypothetical protein